MKSLLAGFLALALAAPGQRIETVTVDSGAVTRVETAVDHLTVIEFGEPVTMAAAGSPLFEIERQGGKVFIQPLDAAASTNLLVWTASGRFSYELVPADSVETAHFVIDQQSPQRNSVVDEIEVEPSREDIAAEILLRGTPIRHLDPDAGHSEVRIAVSDVLRRGDRMLVRYTIDNRSARPFAPAVPEVVALAGARASVSLLTLRYSQISGKAAEAIRDSGRRPIGVVEPDLGSQVVGSGERQSRLLELDFALPESVPAVLQFTFPSGMAVPIVVTLVL